MDLIYPSFLMDQSRGQINFSADRFKVMLVTEEYVAKSKHSRRADIASETEGHGYDDGGKSVRVSIEQVADTTVINLGGAEWSPSTIEARGAIYYKDRGGSPSQDELIAHIDFKRTLISNNGRFALSKSVIEIAERA